MFKTMDIGIDLGTANILVFVKGKGIVLNESAVLAYDQNSGNILAIGNEAKEMLGRAPMHVEAIRPMQEGVIADYETTESILKYFVKKVAGSSFFFKPRVMVCIPSGITSVEKRAVIDATLQAGASKVYLIEEPLAAALGAGLDISRPSGHMVVDIGGGTTDVAVLSMGDIVSSASIRVGGDVFDDAIIRHLRKEKNMMIGEDIAEEVKMKIASVYQDDFNEPFDILGRDMLTGLPATLTISTSDIREPLNEYAQAIIDCIKNVLETTRPELSADILRHGIVLTGGGALLRGLDKRIQDATHIVTIIAENPMECVATGTGRALDNLDKLKDCVTSMEESKRL